MTPTKCSCWPGRAPCFFAKKECFSINVNLGHLSGVPAYRQQSWPHDETSCLKKCGYFCLVMWTMDIRSGIWPKSVSLPHQMPSFANGLFFELIMASGGNFENYIWMHGIGKNRWYIIKCNVPKFPPLPEIKNPIVEACEIPSLPTSSFRLIPLLQKGQIVRILYVPPTNLQPVQNLKRADEPDKIPRQKWGGRPICYLSVHLCVSSHFCLGTLFAHRSLLPLLYLVKKGHI